MKKIALVLSRLLVSSFLWLTCVNGCSGGSTPAQGSVSLTWSIFDSVTGQPTTCAAVSAASAVLQLTSSTGSGTLSLPCARNTGTAALAVGTYGVVPQLVTADGTVLATATDERATVAAGQTTTLVPALFAASTNSGFLAFSLSTGAAGVTNCQPGGAGITGVAMSFEHSGGAGDTGCAKAVVVRSRGGNPLGTYVAEDCSAPPFTSCIEADEVLTAGGLKPGPYTLHVVGTRGAQQCWTVDDAFTLTPGRPLVQAPTFVRSPRC